MFSLSPQKMMQAERSVMNAPASTSQGKAAKWLALSPSNSDGEGCSRSGDSIRDVMESDDLTPDDLKSVISRLQAEVASLTRKLEDVNNDLLWRDTIAARHAEAYALAEQQALQNSSTM
ncbi:MAG TPA: hypothetical protein VIE69_05095 [Methylophilaceae bacterium]|jgi:hypothetical protein